MRKRFNKKDITLVPQIDFGCNESKLDDVIGNANWVWFGPYSGSYQVVFRDGFHLGAGQWLDNWNTRPVDMIKNVMKIPAFQAMCRAVDAEMREFQSHLLPWMPHPSGDTYGDGVMLIGDAGGFPCPLEAEGIWHACMTGKIAAEVAAKAVSSSDTSKSFLKEYERRWEESAVGDEYTFGKEYVGLWRATAFNPEYMKTLGLFLGELQSLSFPGPVFDWSDGHMNCFNDHLGHLLDILPQLAPIAPHITPMGRGISDANREKIANLVVSAIRKKVPFIPEILVKPLVRKMLGKNR